MMTMNAVRGDRLELQSSDGSGIFYLAGEPLENGDSIEVRSPNGWIPARFIWSGRVERWPRLEPCDARATVADLAVLRRFSPDSLCRRP